MKTREMTESWFHVWRGAVALAWGDHDLTADESALLQSFFADQNFSAQQRQQLEYDIKNGITLDAVLPHITNVRDRAHLINLARVIFFADGGFCEDEEVVLDAMKRHHTGTRDIEQALEDAKSQAKEVMSAIEFKEQKEYKKMGVIGRISRLLDNVVLSNESLR